MLSIAEIGEKVGTIDNLEGAVIENIIELDKVLVKTIMTPRTVVVRFMEDLTLNEITPELDKLSFSRIPLYAQDEPDTLTCYVTQRDILKELIKGNKQKKLKEISRPIKTVPDLMKCDSLLLDMFNSKEHLYAVVDEYGGLTGIVTLEDVIEQIIGHEIIDEYGWKQVCNDVFRKPKNLMLLSAFIGTGIELFLMLLHSLIFSVLGFMSPERRGGLINEVI